MTTCDYCGRLVNTGEENSYPQGVENVGEDKETLCIPCLKRMATS